MPTQAFAFEKEGQKRLEITWRGVWKDIRVNLDGQTLGVIPNQKALTAGQEFRLADGSTLKVQLVSKFYSTELQVLRDGRPLPGSASDPLTRVNVASILVYFVAGLNLVLGFLALLGMAFLQQLGFGMISLIAGIIFLALGFFTRRLSSVALILAITLLALDGILGFILAAASGANPGILGLFARAILIIPMIQGVGAIRQVKRQKRAALNPLGG